jgi:hypothetical protein
MNCKTQTKHTWLGEIVCSLAEDGGKNICKEITFRSEFTYQKIIINAIMFILYKEPTRCSFGSIVY